MFIEMLWLFYKVKYWPHTYIKYGGYMKGKNVHDIAYYIPTRLFVCVREDILNDPQLIALIENKYILNRILSWNGIPGTKAYGRYVKGVGFFDCENHLVDTDKFLDSINVDFVFKPVCESYGGSGVMVAGIKADSDKRFLVDNLEMDNCGLKDYLENKNVKGWLFEEKVEQHSQQAAIYEKSLNTIRIDTLRGIHGEVIFGGGFFRIGRNGKRVDNWSAGGIALPVDLKDGSVIGDTAYDYNLNEYKVHPDTKFSFKGYKVPYWDEVRNMLMQTAPLFPDINSVGWDVAISKDGPVIIEGNTNYEITTQAVIGPYMKKPEFMRVLNEHIKNSKYRSRYEKYFRIS